MRVLHLTPQLPYLRGGGTATRQYHLLRRLVELGHEVTVVAPVAPSQRGEETGLESAGIRSLTYIRPLSRWREGLAAVSRRPVLALEAVSRPVLGWQVEVFWTTLRASARAAIEQRPPDVISVQSDSAAPWAGELDSSIPAVLTLDDVMWSYYARRASEASGVQGWGLAVEGVRFKRYDLRHFSHYRTLITVSQHERDKLRRAWEGPVEVLPNGFDSGAIAALPEEAGQPCVLFTGTMSHPPNIEGISWFVEQVWPTVAAALPQTRLLVVGRDPPRSVRRLATDRIEVTGEVPSTLPYFARARVAIVPLWSGGTTRVKVFEALGTGRTVVTTSVGAEGVDVTDGEDALIADDADSFAAAVLRTLNDDALRRRIAGAGRRLAERHDWRTLGDRFEGMLLAAAGQPPRPPRP